MTSQLNREMSDKKATVLSAVVRFGPGTKRELAQLIPEYESHEVLHTLEDLIERGYITIQGREPDETNFLGDEDVVEVNTNPFKLPRENQKVLPWEDNPTREEALAQQLPDQVETDPTMEIELTEDQTKLFEKMRSDVNKGTNSDMDPSEFMNWVLREARRFTEV